MVATLTTSAVPTKSAIVFARSGDLLQSDWGLCVTIPALRRAVSGLLRKLDAVARRTSPPRHSSGIG
ncbi:hypothetical protein BRDID11004_63600 [Bradyrhizobium diazoefficiens]